MMQQKSRAAIPRWVFISYLFKFLGAFCLLYFGSQAIIGYAAPGNLYSPFVSRYLDYPAGLRYSLLTGSKIMLSVFNIESHIVNTFNLRMPGGRGIHLVYSCLGIGVMCCWTAFVFANRGTFAKKVWWIFFGLLLIWLINISRIVILFVIINTKQIIPAEFDNHLFFNITAYMLIFLLAWRYDISLRKSSRIPIKDQGYNAP